MGEGELAVLPDDIGTGDAGFGEDERVVDVAREPAVRELPRALQCVVVLEFLGEFVESAHPGAHQIAIADIEILESGDWIVLRGDGTVYSGSSPMAPGNVPPGTVETLVDFKGGNDFDTLSAGLQVVWFRGS